MIQVCNRKRKVDSGAMNIKKLDLLKIRNLKFRTSQRQVVIDRLLRKKDLEREQSLIMCHYVHHVTRVIKCYLYVDTLPNQSA